MSRIIALDVGDKTVGVAVSDELNLTAQGTETIFRTSLKKDIGRIAEIAKAKDAKKIIMGLPKNMNGTEGERSKIVRDFAEKTARALPQVEIDFWDERLSTVAAERVLIDADMSRKKRKKVVDKMAAVLILQGYLDSQRK